MSSAKDVKYSTAKSFFSKDNSNHPIVSEHEQLKRKLKFLEQMKGQSSRVGTPADSDMSMRNLERQKT